MEFGGVLSGEHGIGLEKRRFFTRTLEPAVIELTKGIKNVVDPQI